MTLLFTFDHLLLAGVDNCIHHVNYSLTCLCRCFISAQVRCRPTSNVHLLNIDILCCSNNNNNDDCFTAPLCHAMLWISAAYAVVRCLSVRLSVRPSITFVDSVETNKHVFNFFSPSGSYTILVFHTKRYGDVPKGSPLTGASNAGGVGTNRDSRPIYGYRIDDCWSASDNCDGRPCSLPHRRWCISECLFITAYSMDDHDEEKRTNRTEFSLRSDKGVFIVTQLNSTELNSTDPVE